MDDTPRALAAPAAPEVWRQPDGTPVSCADKIKVLNRNLDEIRQAAQDALEDGVLMGVDERQLRAALRGVIDELENPYGPGPTKA
ncbi:MAG: hypothetical protein JNK11_06695 [Alphaproteobacteria bacterium]|nr:hypothetical protein [Alphaproteobacteria bacterium]